MFQTLTLAGSYYHVGLLMLPTDLREPYRLGDKTVQGRFVIPSGIRCTHAATILRCFLEVPAIGVITTKSISA